MEMHVCTKDRNGQNRLALPLAVIVVLAGTGRLAAEVMFNFNFTDAPGIGFNAFGQTGIDRRQGLQNAGNYLAGFFGNYTATIDMNVNGSETNDTTLASAGSNINSAYPGFGFGTRGDVMTKILGGNGADPDVGAADGTVNWNFEDFAWEPLNDFQLGEMDLFSTAVHELLHAVGFASGINQDGTGPWTGDPVGTPTAWTPFDEFVADMNGTLVSPGAALDTGRWNAASVGGTDTTGLFFVGANAMAANGGNPVNLYSPATWVQGSSGSHLDTDFFNVANGRQPLMMNHEAAVAEGLDIRVLSSIELGLLQDIGYTNLLLTPVPEPSSVFAILTVGSLYLLNRRRRVRTGAAVESDE